MRQEKREGRVSFERGQNKGLFDVKALAEIEKNNMRGKNPLKQVEIRYF